MATLVVQNELLTQYTSGTLCPLQMILVIVHHNDDLTGKSNVSPSAAQVALSLNQAFGSIAHEDMHWSDSVVDNALTVWRRSLSINSIYKLVVQDAENNTKAYQL